MKRAPFLWHRYLGIALCGLFALWFVTGVAMLYVRMPITVSVTNLLNANVHPLFVATNAEPVRADLWFSNGGAGNSLPGRGVVIGLEVRR